MDEDDKPKGIGSQGWRERSTKGTEIDREEVVDDEDWISRTTRSLEISFRVHDAFDIKKKRSLIQILEIRRHRK